MSNSRIEKVNLNDCYRALLTEVLPYETLMIFSNDGFHRLLLEDSSTCDTLFNCDIKKSHFFIPYSYDIRRTELKIRHLSIPHPVIQMELCEFYEKYKDYIIYLCEKSSFSLRHPCGVASKFYRKGIIADDICNDAVQTASNFFAYSKYRLLYQFYNNIQFIKLEKKYTYLRKIDISKCFLSIYTHSIAWAVKGKEIAKNQISTFNFENEFDKLMQHSNYNETAGIIIGPEFSRIFAEIIFQYLDVKLEKSLNDDEMKFRTNYEIYRYVDDFFVFANSKDDLDKIQKKMSTILEEFRLSINENKTIDFEVPFSSNVSNAKEELKYFFNNFFESVNKKDEKITIEKSKLRFESLVQEYKSIISRNQTNIYSINSYSFHRLKKFIKKFRNNTELCAQEETVCIQFLELLIRFSFYTYSLDVRVTTTYNISYILIAINEFINFNEKKKNVSEKNSLNLKKIIFDEICKVLKKEISIKNTDFIEIANLLIVLKSLKYNEKMSLVLFDKIWNKVKEIEEDKSINYFGYITALYFCINDNYYKEKEEKIVDSIENILKDFNPKKTDHFLLLTDYLCCPAIDVTRKIGFLSSQTNFLKNYAEKKFIQKLEKNNVFTDWTNDVSLIHKLEKREFLAPYD